MARLIRMDHTGHTTLAEWTAADDAAFAAAARAFQEQLEAGLYGVVSEGEGQARQVTSLPADAELRHPAAPDRRRVSAAAAPLPESAAVYWRRRVDERYLHQVGWSWTVLQALHPLPFVAMAAFLIVLEPLTFPVGVIMLVHAWVIPGSTRSAAPTSCARGRAATPPPSRLRSACSAT